MSFIVILIIIILVIPICIGYCSYAKEGKKGDNPITTSLIGVAIILFLVLVVYCGYKYLRF